MKKIVVLLLSLTVVGCATTDADYYQAQIEVARAYAAAQQARTAALAQIGSSDDPAAKVAAAMALSFDQVLHRQPTVQQAPNQALQWASVLAGPLTQILLGKYARDVAINNSNNAASVSMNTNETMAGMASTGMIGAVALGQSGITGMAASNQAGIDGIVNLGTFGFESLGTLGAQGINSTFQGSAYGYDYVNPTPVVIVP